MGFYRLNARLGSEDCLRGLYWRSGRVQRYNHQESSSKSSYQSIRLHVCLNRLQARFSINLDESRLAFVYLKSRKWVEDKSWPYVTLLGQSLGSIRLSFEALGLLVPDYFYGISSCS